MAAADFSAVLRCLVDREAAFIVVGGIAALVQGAPVVTFDLDIVHSREPENIGRLLLALDDLQAVYRRCRDLRPSADHLKSPGHQLLLTVHGPLDLLDAIETGLDYQRLLPLSQELDFGLSSRIRVLGLETLTALKAMSNHPKDVARLELLRQTLRRTSFAQEQITEDDNEP